MVAVTPQDPRASQAQVKAAILREALPWITQFRGDTVVIKYGGSAMVDHDLKESFAADVVLLHVVGLRPVIVHGGGPQISAAASQMGVEPAFVAGLRVTDDAMMDVVRKVLLDQVNPQIVGLLKSAGGAARGVAGTDQGLLLARKALGPNGEDLGRVGQVTHVDASVLERILDDGFVPVVASVARDEQDAGDLNVNADVAAGAIASAMKARKLVYLTDVSGLYLDFGDEGSLIPELSSARVQSMLETDSLHEGMRPKVSSVVGALASGVPQAHILDGRMLHAVLLEIFTDAGVGTMIRADAE